MEIKKQRSIFIHILFFTMFIILPALVMERLPDENFFTFTRAVVQDSIFNITIWIFLYLNYYLFVPKLYFQNKYVLYILVVLLYLVVILPIPHLIGKLINEDFVGRPPGPPPSQNTLSPILENTFPKLRRPDTLFIFSFRELSRHLYLFLTAFLLSFLVRTREYLAKIKEDKLNAELSLLNAQINPHFLFNTLNSIYALSIKKDDRTSDAILSLSGLMRYITSESRAQKIPFKKELAYINDYLKLQKARLGSTINIDYQFNTKITAQQIAPLILITFIENAFEYGVNPNRNDCKIILDIQLIEKQLNFHIFNRKLENTRDEFKSNGIGLKNTIERLHNIYPNRHTLTIQEESDTYDVNLSIDLT